MEWTPEADAVLKQAWAEFDGKIPKVARAIGLTKGQVAGRSMRLNLQHRHSALTKPLADDSPALVEMRSMFQKGVRDPDGHMLRTGRDQRKIGERVQKGAWKGFPVFTLTLEERATCPSDCELLAHCYGNHMPWSVRYRHGEDLERALWSELFLLQVAHPKGFVIRLHILGDFYSLDYVRLWHRALDTFKGLHVFGYTHWKPETEIGRHVAALSRLFWRRFAIRLSDADGDAPRTRMIARAEDAKPGEIICPAQTGKTRSCSTCALCWAAPKKTIAFLLH